MPRPKPSTHAFTAVSMSLHVIALLMGTDTCRLPFRNCHSLRGAKPTCRTQVCLRRSFDDAIVVVENVERQLEAGLKPLAAARAAMKEVTGPIIATTAVLMAVFVPVAFIPGSRRPPL